MERAVNINGKEMRMRASALIPRLYRYKFGRDAIADMLSLKRAYDKAAALPDTATEEERREAQFSALDLTIFENMAWIMLKHAGEEVGDSPDEWLDSIDGIFSIYEFLPEIIDLWQMNQATTSKPRKK